MLDASAALELLLNTPLAAEVSRRAFARGESLHAPHLLDVEIAQVLRRLVRRSEIDSARAPLAFDDLHDPGIARCPHGMPLRGIWTLRADASAYDAAYLVLALEPGATLVTGDAALATVPAKGLRVEVIA